MSIDEREKHRLKVIGKNKLLSDPSLFHFYLLFLHVYSRLRNFNMIIKRFSCHISVTKAKFVSDLNLVVENISAHIKLKLEKVSTMI